MNPSKSIFACLVLLVAAGLALVGRGKSPSTAAQHAASDRSMSATRIAEISTTRNGSKTVVRVAPTALDLTVRSDDAGQQAVCAKVESDARSELQELDERLKLTKTQQQRIFPILARRSAAFSPAMKAGGQSAVATNQSAEDAISSELDPARQGIYQEMLLDDAAWWSEALTRLESSQDEAAAPLLSQPSPAQ